MNVRLTDSETASIIVNGYRDRLVKQVRESIVKLRASAATMTPLQYASAAIEELKLIGIAHNDLETAEDGLLPESRTPDYAQQCDEGDW